MKKLFLCLITCLIFHWDAVAVHSGAFSIVHQTNREELSYNLPITGEFQIAFLNALKTGDLVKVVHRVKIRPVNQWFGWLAEKQYVKFYKYDLIGDQYYIGVKDDDLKPVPSIKILIDDITALNSVPFLPKNILKIGNAYEINFDIIINPTEDSIGTLLFTGDRLKERLSSAVHYINK